MKRIINGRVYNTDTATEVAETSHGYRSDFAYWAETLYRTPRGNWFLYGEGGPASRYSETIGQNQWSGGARIRAMTEADVLEWVEENGINPDDIAEHIALESA